MLTIIVSDFKLFRFNFEYGDDFIFDPEDQEVNLYPEVDTPADEIENYLIDCFSHPSIIVTKDILWIKMAQVLKREHPEFELEIEEFLYDPPYQRSIEVDKNGYLSYQPKICIYLSEVLGRLV